MSRSRIKRHSRIARTARMRAAMHPGFTGVVFDVWRRAREVFRQFFDRHDYSIQRLVACEYIPRAEHRRMSDWLLHLEVLVRHLVITAALAIKVTLSARLPRLRKRSRRIAIIWDDKPWTWRRLHFSIFPGHSAGNAGSRSRSAPPPRLMRSLPVARRLETLRRILVAPAASARRAAFHLARLAAANRKSNQPRKLHLDAGAPRTRLPSRGWQAIQSGIDQLIPLCDDRIDAWNRGADPG